MSASVNYEGPVWDTTDANNPQPNVYPVCPTCHVTWVWRRFLSFTTGGYVWAWSKDCKHKADPDLHTPDSGTAGSAS